MTLTLTEREAAEAGLTAGKPSKYRNVRTACYQGHTHDSRKEADRCDVLHDMQAKGEIRELQRQVTFQLYVGKEHICSYRADFVYYDRRKGLAYTVEDVKSAGTKTREYVIKRKLMHACLGITILES